MKIFFRSFIVELGSPTRDSFVASQGPRCPDWKTSGGRRIISSEVLELLFHISSRLILSVDKICSKLQIMQVFEAETWRWLRSDLNWMANERKWILKWRKNLGREEWDKETNLDLEDVNLSVCLSVCLVTVAMQRKLLYWLHWQHQRKCLVFSLLKIKREVFSTKTKRVFTILQLRKAMQRNWKSETHVSNYILQHKSWREVVRYRCQKRSIARLSLSLTLALALSRSKPLVFYS